MMLISNQYFLQGFTPCVGLFYGFSSISLSAESSMMTGLLENDQ